MIESLNTAVAVANVIDTIWYPVHDTLTSQYRRSSS